MHDRYDPRRTHEPSRRGRPTRAPTPAEPPLLQLQRQLGNAATARLVSRLRAPAGSPQLQRFIDLRDGQPQENGTPPPGFIALGGYWVEFDAARWAQDAAYRQRLVRFHSAPPAYATPGIGFFGDLNATNDLGDQLGCSNCVAADYLGEKLSAFQANHGNPQRTGRTGPEGYDFFRGLGIQVESEEFSDVTAMCAEIFKDGLEGNWTGALAWGGHIIRVRMRDGGFIAWDPQGLLGAMALVPNGVPLFLMTFL